MTASVDLCRKLQHGSGTIIETPHTSGAHPTVGRPTGSLERELGRHSAPSRHRCRIASCRRSALSRNAADTLRRADSADVELCEFRASVEINDPGQQPTAVVQDLTSLDARSRPYVTASSCDSPRTTQSQSHTRPLRICRLKRT